MGWRRVEGTIAGLLALMAVAAHTLRLLHAGGLWRDEAAAVCLATLPSLRAVAHWFPHEAFPLAVPLTFRLYARLAGDGDLAWRALGLGIGLAIVGALWLDARVAGRTLPLVSLALLAGNAGLVIYGDSLRGYGLGTLFILLAFGALANLLRRPGPGATLAALCAVLAAVHCLLANSALVAALCAAAIATALWRRQRRLAFVVLDIGIAAALSLLPYVPELAAARQWNVVVTYPADGRKILQTLGATSGPGAARWLWLGLALGGVVYTAWRLGRPGTAVEIDRGVAPPAPDDGILLFCALVLVLAIAAEVVFLVILGYRPRVWYYLPLIALIAASLDPIAGDLCRAAPARAWRAALALLGGGALLASSVAAIEMRMTNVDLASRRVAAAASADDLVLVSPWYYGVTFNRYYHGAAGWLTLPDLPEHGIHRYDLLKARMAAGHPLADVEAELRRTLLAGHRVWLVGDLRYPPAGLAAPVLPPAPASPAGWHENVYVQSWSLQLGELLRDHAVSIDVLPLPAAGPINPSETVSLAVVRGWR